jgi:hypothetical protein
MTEYHVRSQRGRTVMTFTSEQRARDFVAHSRTPLRLVRVRHVEEELRA